MTTKRKTKHPSYGKIKRGLDNLDQAELAYGSAAPATCPICGETYPTLVYLGVGYCIVCDEDRLKAIWASRMPSAASEASRGVLGPLSPSDAVQANVDGVAGTLNRRAQGFSLISSAPMVARGVMQKGTP